MAAVLEKYEAGKNDASREFREQLNQKDLVILELNQKIERLEKDLKLKTLETTDFFD